MELTEKNYYSKKADKLFLSNSQYQDFKKCELMAMAKIKGKYNPEPTKAMVVGSYVDAYFEGTLNKFTKNHPEIFTKQGKLRADYRKADDMIARAEKDKLFMKYMSGEKQVIETANVFSADWKIKIDSLLPDAIVDLKTCRSFDRVYGISFIQHWGYDTQLAIYQRVHQAVSGKLLPVYIAAVTKEEIPDIEIISIPQWRLDECIAQVQNDVPRILNLKAGHTEPKDCGVCDYCKSVKTLTEPLDFELIGFSKEERKQIG